MMDSQRPQTDDDGPARLLVAGDLHLGKRPRLPASAEGLDAAKATPQAAWDSLVERALAARVDAVLLAGDVVNDDGDVFLAGRIADGVQRLAAAGIDVLAVVGNHDARALPHLVQGLGQLQLIGSGGTWESVLVRRGERPVARVAGWSFPARHHPASPLDGAPDWLRSGVYDDGVDVPVVGLLHCELSSTGGAYAPVPPVELEACLGVDAWLLGHEHHVTLDPAVARPMGYLGTLAPLDVTETGARGPWLARARAGGGHAWELEHVPASWLRCERLVVDVSDVARGDELDAALLAAVRERHAAIAGELADTRVVMVRAELVGRTAGHGAVRERVAAYGEESGLLATQSIDGVTWAFDDAAVRDRSRPAIDVAALAQLADPRGELARTLLVLEAGGPDAGALVAEAARELGGLARRGTFAQLQPWHGEAEVVRAALVDAAQEALELLTEGLGTEVPA